MFLFQRLHELVHQLTISNEYGRLADGRHNLDRLSDVVRSGHLFARLGKNIGTQHEDEEMGWL